MKYIILNSIKYYVTLRRAGDFVCNKCGRPKFAALAERDISNSFDILICSKCGDDCGGDNEKLFQDYLKRQKMSLKTFFKKIDYKMEIPSRKIVKIRRKKKCQVITRNHATSQKKK